MEALTFGPVPSRRLGRSLGINNIPPKTCSLSCVYCQLGRTLTMRVERGTFFTPEAIVAAVSERLAACARASEAVDALTVVPDGEPTLDESLGRTLEALRSFGHKVAVITNATLLWCDAVRDDLAQADWVSVKVDAVRDEPWHAVGRPHGRLRLPGVLEGIRAFARGFPGELVTETMLVAGVNDSDDHLRQLSAFLGDLVPSIAYLAVPIRPPAEQWVKPPDPDRLVAGYRILAERLPRVELLADQPKGGPARTGGLVDDLLAITAVHPLNDSAVVQLAGGDAEGLEVAESLVARGLLASARFAGDRFFVRRFQRERKPA